MTAAIGSEELITVALILAVWVLPSFWVASLARSKGRPHGMWLIAALVFNWLVLLIAVLILPDRSAHRAQPTT